MSQLELKKITKDVIDHAEEAMVAPSGLGKVVDDYLIQHLKQDELEHAQVDAKLYDGLRVLVRTEALPLYEQYLAEVKRLRERTAGRKLWRYVLGTVAAIEVLEMLLTRGRSFAPQVFIPSAVLNAFLGFVLYQGAQYLDERHLRSARRRLERSIEGLDRRVRTDVDYDNRRQLVDSDLMRAEALEILTHYERAEDFWRDYKAVREADPTTPGALQQLNRPAFARFLKFHIDGTESALSRQFRFNRLFLDAHEALINRDRAQYVIQHLQRLGSL